MAIRERRIVVELSYTFEDGKNPVDLHFLPVGDLARDRSVLREEVRRLVGEGNFVVTRSYVTGDYGGFDPDLKRCPVCMMTGQYGLPEHEVGCPKE
jgi:hypothetical protein